MLFRLVSFTGNSRTVKPGTSICTPGASALAKGGSGCLSGTGGIGGSAEWTIAAARRQSAAGIFMRGFTRAWTAFQTTGQTQFFRAALHATPDDPNGAVGVAMDTAGKAVLFSGITVLISLSAVLLVPIPARPIKEYKLTVSDAQMTALQWILLAAMPGSALVLGALVWLRRRR